MPPYRSNESMPIEVQVTDARCALVRRTADRLMEHAVALQAAAERMIAEGVNYVRDKVEAMRREADALINRAIGLDYRADLLADMCRRLMAREAMAGGRA